jgi:hypothetical protein
LIFIYLTSEVKRLFDSLLNKRFLTGLLQKVCMMCLTSPYPGTTIDA